MPSDETRERILGVSARIFGKYGFQKTTIDEIAHGAHKAKGSVYYYFESKEELFRAVVADEISIIKSGLTKVLINSPDVTSMIRNFLITRMTLLKDATNYHETVRAEFTGDFDFLGDIRAEFFRFELELLKAILDKGVKDQTIEVKDTSATAQVIMMAFKAIEIPFYLQKKFTQYEQTVVELLDILIRGLEKGSSRK
jgi:AcrR family transcriptional regulator